MLFMKPDMSKALVSPRTFAPPRSYEELLHRLRETLEAGRGRARKLLEEIQSRMFWETGRWIDLYLKHEKQTAGRAPYGEKVIPKLAEDLTYDKDYLYDSLNVYRNNTIFGTYRELPVGHHRALLRVKDTARRKALAAEAKKEGWTRRELARRIHGQARLPDGGKPAPAPGTFTLRARKGKLRHYRIVERNGRLFLDLGFRDFRDLKGKGPEGDFQDGDIVEGTSLDQLTKKPGAAKTDLYTYKAEVLRFPDADTYWLFIDKGFGGFRDDKIRLRGIDSPEIATPEGAAAKAFVEELLTLPDGERTQESSPYSEVLITTTKTPDKWDRYLVDLYFEKDGREIYLNRLLLDQGHAVPYKE
jgi:endonuclease YncB( thermonuclease family)